MQGNSKLGQSKKAKTNKHKNQILEYVISSKYFVIGLAQYENDKGYNSLFLHRISGDFQVVNKIGTTYPANGICIPISGYSL